MGAETHLDRATGCGDLGDDTRAGLGPGPRVAERLGAKALGDEGRIAIHRRRRWNGDRDELDCITLDPSNLFQRNLTYDEFDVSEMSISETLLARERTDGKKWDWSALPVFLSRGHHWHTLYVNTAAGIKSLADLRGKRIGVPDYDMTAALWFRIALKDLHGWGRAGPGHGRAGGRHPMGTDYGHHDHAAHLDGLRNLRTAGGISARVYDKIVDAKPRAAYAL